MKQTLLFSAACAAVGLILGGCATSAPKPSDRFTQIDTNHDGKLSLDEINTYLVNNIFQSRDTNHDGKLTLQEWGATDDPGHVKIFRDRDANHDGVVTREEALAYGRTKGGAARTMKAADTNKDHFLSRAEVTAYYGGHEGPPR